MGELRISNTGGFHVGVAYSPHYGHNFGDAIWGVEHGLHRRERLHLVERDFTSYARHGITFVSMKVFDDGRTGIEFDARDPGYAVQVQPSALAGLDNVLSAAADTGLCLHLVLLDHLFAYPGSGRCRGHGAALREAAHREAFFETVIGPVLRLIGRYPHVMGMELINEPDLVCRGLHGNMGDGRGRRLRKLPASALLAALERFRGAVDAETDAQFAIGCLGVGKAAFWLRTGLLDPARHFLSIHYFARRANGDPPYPALYGPSGIGPWLDWGVPIIWGEHPADGSPAPSLTQFLDDAARHGVRGCCGWAAYDALGNDGGDGFGPLRLDEYARFTTDRRL